MHIPDGFLSLVVALIFWALAILAIGYALSRVRGELKERQVPMMGILAAVIFAGQMLNFSVAGGTSGHLLGAALAAILIGPWPAVLIMTCVVSVQALIFQDGGLLALGANLFNMAVVGVFVAWGIYRLIRKITPDTRWSKLLAGFLAAWASIEIASLVAAIQLALSGTSPANVAIPAMAGIHAIIGLGEGLITIGALAFLMAVRPGLLDDKSAPGESRLVWIGGLAAAILLAVLSPLASAHPDGLEWVAEQTGFLDAAQGPAYEIIPDYVLPGISNEAAATILAGVVGVGIVLAAAWLVTRIRKSSAAG
ncbi:MAG: energy-coupling factor ABC transporter permease [Anaerolineales bacterium]|nr:energy-coupling factor ABC transporter permease [Anaerolineales bacterium]